MKELIQRTTGRFASVDTSDQRLPDDLWVKCPRCSELTYRKQVFENLKVCPRCGHHMRMSGREWIGMLDPGSFHEEHTDLLPTDPLGFVSLKESYAAKLKESQKRTGLKDVVISGKGRIDGQALMVAVCDFSFMGASMGSVYGEKMTRAAERAAELGLPLLTINCSGGARMQEGVISLMQMAKISMALSRLAAAGLPHISLLVDPCYGGVTASYASVADVIIAEPGANIGFAGKRVIEGTIRQKLPPDFQTAEFMLEHGMIDMVVPRGDLRSTLSRLLKFYAARPETADRRPKPDMLADISAASETMFSAWDRVQIARNPQRPRTQDYLRGCFEDFIELHGDRRYGDDPAIVAGLASFQGQTVMVIGHQKGRDTRENVRRNFGMPHPEGYRKALRLFQQAEKFGFPVICFIDTPGANPNKDSEERGQANAIAENILVMAGLKTPIIACLIGEGGSGGALALGVADRLLMLEHAVYSVASPEAAASILWRDAGRAPDAAQAMRITAPDLLELGIADAIIPEPEGGAHNDALAMIGTVRAALQAQLAELQAQPTPLLLSKRYDKYRAIGEFEERSPFSSRLRERVPVV
ncbi:MAG: acetyl-CoA carboxylase carboxyltransferase subunit alpha [Chloroflexaceae bacterium]|jgi:acetyl-CoA carboxylase carboxyl transferase subunit beta|nr:acetyl-CoA carboxylase carboxyltransferase subunit alpha [Chloroflexaceae bacterium]